MVRRCTLPSLALIAIIGIARGANAHEELLYPDLKGGWLNAGFAYQWDPTKPAGLKQDAPLTLEYQAVFEANLAETERGGQSYNPQTWCLPGGMPRLLLAYSLLEFVVTPPVTYLISDHLTELRHIYTDGRDWPAKIPTSFEGYSIGKWIDEDGDGRFDVLEVESRGFKGPRVLDHTGIPVHRDNATVIKERIFIDKADPNILRDVITTIDNAFTRPWTVTRSLRRHPGRFLMEQPCAEGNRYMIIGKETYVLTVDRRLMPTRKDQPPPDLRYFEQAQKN
jgi:hypothetical protein